MRTGIIFKPVRPALTVDADIPPGDPNNPVSGFIRSMMGSIVEQITKSNTAKMPDGMSLAGVDMTKLTILELLQKDLDPEALSSAFQAACLGWAVLFSLAQDTLHAQAGPKGVRALETAIAKYCGIDKDG